jgi:acetyl-CoA carboxylase biotin carboxyl carrier protein
MAANVWRVLVTVGAEVVEEQELVILESMKMEIPVVSPQNGVVTELSVNEGDQVAAGDLLITVGSP